MMQASSDLVSFRYGKARVKILKVDRTSKRHKIKEVQVCVLLSGSAFKPSFWGDNSMVIPTDTIRNRLYALAQREQIVSVEEFGLKTVEHFLAQYHHVANVEVEISECLWKRISDNESGERGHDHSFERIPGLRTAQVRSSREGKAFVTSGMKEVCILKSTGSGFEGFLKDRFTNLIEMQDRIFSTLLNATWNYVDGVDLGTIEYNRVWNKAKKVFLQVFSQQYSKSVQETLRKMAEALVHEELIVESVSITLPNRHYVPFDVTQFGEPASACGFTVFHPVDEPSGMIEGTVARTTHSVANKACL